MIEFKMEVEMKTVAFVPIKRDNQRFSEKNTKRFNDGTSHITVVFGVECVDIDHPEDCEMANAIYMKVMRKGHICRKRMDLFYPYAAPHLVSLRMEVV